jgi:hypothetical protein
MSRGKWKIDKETGKLVPYEKKSSVQTHGVIPDEICIESMVDGKIYTSKAELRRHYKRAGYIEKDKGYRVKQENTYESYDYKAQLEEDAARAYYAVRDNMAPLSELDRERCKIINNNLENYNYDRRYFDDDGKPRE